MTHEMPHHITPIGTICGMIFSLIALPSAATLSVTIILALCGAVTGFVTTLACKSIWKWIITKFKK